MRRATCSSARSTAARASRSIARASTAAGRTSTRDVAAGQSIRYKVFALAADGRIVGVSRADTVLVPTLATP